MLLTPSYVSSPSCTAHAASLWTGSAGGVLHADGMTPALARDQASLPPEAVLPVSLPSFTFQRVCVGQMRELPSGGQHRIADCRRGSQPPDPLADAPELPLPAPNPDKSQSPRRTPDRHARQFSSARGPVRG